MSDQLAQPPETAARRALLLRDAVTLLRTLQDALQEAEDTYPVKEAVRLGIACGVLRVRLQRELGDWVSWRNDIHAKRPDDAPAVAEST